MSAAENSAFTLIVRTHLTPDESHAIANLIERITDFDGLQPLSEHVWLHLKSGGDENGVHILGYREDEPETPCGYAHLDVTDAVEGPCAELAVDPSARRAGLGRLIVEELIALAAGIAGEPDTQR